MLHGKFQAEQSRWKDPLSVKSAVDFRMPSWKSKCCAIEEISCSTSFFGTIGASRQLIVLFLCHYVLLVLARE